MVRVTAEPCSECPWKGGCRLGAGRLRELREETKQKGGVFICHQSMGEDYDDKIVCGPGGNAAVCSGWLDLGDEPAELQIAFRLGYVERVKIERRET